MKKKLIAILLILVMIVLLTGCSHRADEAEPGFRYAQIAMPDGSVVAGELSGWHTWRNYSGEDDMVLVTIGTVTYLTHYENVVLWG